MSDRIAIIDIGTNTVNLLIVDRDGNQFKTIHSERTGVGLGHGGINNSIITKPAFKRGIDCLNQYSDICKAHHTDKIKAFGTSALRHASNASDFIKQVKKNTNIDIDILNGQAEAQLIYNGIKHAYSFPEKSVIMDIGGGSTEFILADKTGVIDKLSLEIGVSRINQHFNFCETFSQNDIYKITNYLDHKIGNQLDSFSTNQLIGSSGSFETFYELTHQINYPKGEYKSIPVKYLKNTLNQVINSSLSDRIKNPFIIPIRREMLPIAAVKTLWVLDKLNCQQIIVSPNSLKEGAIFSS